MRIKGISKTVFFLGLVSFFTDLSSEMIYPLLPIFLSTALGAGAAALGIIEGIAESTASLLKVASGIWTDRMHHRKPLILAGYSVSSLARPLIGLATVWPFVLAMRFIDRVGKGLRTSPRDALIADTTDMANRGSAYGFHRAMDHAGAVIGPLVAAGLLAFEYLSLRHVFLLSAIPAIIVIIILIAGVKEPRITLKQTPQMSGLAGHWRDLGADFKYLLTALLIFTLGNSTDAFLLLRLSDAGVPVVWIGVLWSMHHVVKMFSTYIGGRLSDKIGHRTMIIFGWMVYAVIYVAFAIIDSPGMLIVIFLAYGIYFGLTEPVEKALVSNLVPSNLCGTAFGYYHGVIGLGALPASLIFGFIWHFFGVTAAFLTGAGFAVVASFILLRVRRSPSILS
ncbi:MAG: MFS transporter [Pseudomonadota bacterium]